MKERAREDRRETGDGGEREREEKKKGEREEYIIYMYINIMVRWW